MKDYLSQACSKPVGFNGHCYRDLLSAHTGVRKVTAATSSCVTWGVLLKYLHFWFLHLGDCEDERNLHSMYAGTQCLHARSMPGTAFWTHL